MQDFWNSWYAAVGTGEGHFFYTNLIRFPEGTTLNYHSFAYPHIAAVALLSKIFGTAHTTVVLLHNLVLLSTFPLAGTGAFYLVRHFVKSTGASLVGGFVFAFNPSHVAHLTHHVHVSSIEFIPFFALAYLLAIEKKSTAWLCAAVFFYVLSAVSCWYYLFYIAYFIVFHGVYLGLRDRQWPKHWNLIAPVTCIGATFLLLLPLLIPMIQQSGGNHVYQEGSNIFVADVASLIAFPPTHLLAELGAGVYWRVKGGPWEGAVYLGLINLALLAWLMLRPKGLKNPTLVYVICGMFTFCLFAGGETIQVLGHSLPLPLPGAALSKLPFFANVRTPSRAIVMVYLFLSIGVGYAVAQAWEKSGSASSRALVGVIVLLLLLDFYPTNIATTDARCSTGLDTIAQDREPSFAVLNLPIGYAAGNAAMLQQTCHGHPILQGSISRLLTTSLVDRLATSDLDAQRKQLAAAHVKYIIISPDKKNIFEWKKAYAPKTEYSRKYHEVFHEENFAILRIN